MSILGHFLEKLLNLLAWIITNYSTGHQSYMNIPQHILRNWANVVYDNFFPYNLFKRYRIIMSSSSIALPLLNFKKWITSGHTQKHSLLWSHENCTFLTYYLRPFCRRKRMHLSPKSEKKLYKGKITTVQQNDILYFTCVIKPKKVSQCKKFALRLQ